MQTVETFVAEDGTRFTDAQKCQEHESKLLECKTMISAKIGVFETHELVLGGPRGEAVLDSLPFTAPWMGPYGSCLITITDIRRNADGKVEFQLGDEQKQPYENGTVWRQSESFYSEWPQ